MMPISWQWGLSEKSEPHLHGRGTGTLCNPSCDVQHPVAFLGKGSVFQDGNLKMNCPDEAAGGKNGGSSHKGGLSLWLWSHTERVVCLEKYCGVTTRHAHFKQIYGATAEVLISTKRSSSLAALLQKTSHSFVQEDSSGSRNCYLSNLQASGSRSLRRTFQEKNGPVWWEQRGSASGSTHAKWWTFPAWVKAASVMQCMQFPRQDIACETCCFKDISSWEKLLKQRKPFGWAERVFIDFERSWDKDPNFCGVKLKNVESDTCSRLCHDATTYISRKFQG